MKDAGIMTRAVLAAGLLGLCVSGCGGGNKQPAAAPTAPQASTSPATTSTPTRAPHKPAHPPRKPPHQAAAKKPPNHQAQAQQIATSVLSSAGLHVVSVSASTDGSSIQATIATAGACDTSQKESGLAGQVEHLAPYAHSVAIVVAGGGQTLDQYVATSCSTKSLPTGQGPVVLKQSGTGMADTAQFTVHSASWTIDYVNNGRVLNVFPFKGSTATSGGIVAKPHSSGSKIEHGAGTYMLRISGFGSWSIQVRDGP